MKKILFFIAIASFSVIGFSSCSEDDTVLETPVPNQNPNIGQQLTLTANASYSTEKKRYFSQLGNQVMLSATSGGSAVSDATFYVNGKEIMGNQYTSNTITTVTVQAKRAGYLDSNVITIQFAQKPYF